MRSGASGAGTRVMALRFSTDPYYTMLPHVASGSQRERSPACKSAVKEPLPTLNTTARPGLSVRLRHARLDPSHGQPHETKARDKPATAPTLPEILVRSCSECFSM